ncbi:hypothetical protein [Dysosmobacter welbionis]
MNKLLKDLYDCFYTPPERRSGKSRNATARSLRRWASRSADWC